MVSPSVSLDSAAYIALFCFHIMLATLVVTFNGLVVVAILSSKKLRSENRFLYILNTCLAGLTLGALWFYSGLIYVNPKAITTVSLLLYNIWGAIFLTILSSQCERYFAVSSPFRYMIVMSFWRNIGIQIFCWIFPLVMSLIYGFLGNSTTSVIKGIGSIISNVAVFTIMAGLNIKLYLIAKVQQEREITNFQKDTKKSSLSLIVLVSSCFLIFWTPSSVRECVCSFTTCTRYNTSVNPFAILTAVSSAINPILYLCGSQVIWATVKKTCLSHAVCKR